MDDATPGWTVRFSEKTISPTEPRRVKVATLAVTPDLEVLLVESFLNDGRLHLTVRNAHGTRTLTGALDRARARLIGEALVAFAEAGSLAGVGGVDAPGQE